MSATGAAIADAAGRLCRPTDEATLGGIRCPTYRRSDFRLQWIATRLHTFVFVIEVPTAASRGEIVSIAEESRAWARRHKGGLPRGFQTGSAALPVLVVPEVGHLRQWAEEPQPLRFACPLFPLVVGIDGTVAFRTKRQRVGFVYESFFRVLAADLVAATAAAQ